VRYWPCSAVYTYDRAVDDPHYVAREVFSSWPTVDGGSIKGVGVVPKFTRRPGRVWRGAPSIGMDNDDILRQLGLTDAQIEALYATGVVTREEQ
jgi:L-carnitine CoA-transferase